VLAVKRASLARRMANDVTKKFCNIFQQLKHLFGEDLRETAKNSILKQKKNFFRKKNKNWSGFKRKKQSKRFDDISNRWRTGDNLIKVLTRVIYDRNNK